MTLRSWLFAPADDPHKMDKAWASGADAVILDLEDAVAPPRKAEAREQARRFIEAHAGRAGPQLWVRINPLTGELAKADLLAIVPAGPAGVVLPKPDSAAVVRAALHRIARLEESFNRTVGAIHILPIATETPRALFSLGTYAELDDPRLAGLTWGAEDLPAAVGAQTNRLADGRYIDLCRIARSLALAAAAAAGVPALETVYPAFGDGEGLAAYAEQGRREGFAGMLAIHPAQVETINRVFTPAPEELERARRIVELFEANPGSGVLALDGRMLDAPHLKQAKRLLGVRGS